MGIVRGHTVIAREAAEQGMARLRRWGAEMLDRAPGTVAPNSDVQLSPVDGKVVYRVARALRNPFLWVNDNFCLSRAALGAYRGHAHVERLIAGGRAEAAPIEDAVYAGMAQTRRTVRREFVDGRRGWDYHAAPAMLRKGDREPTVVDYLLFDEPVPVSVWAERLGMKPHNIRYFHPEAPMARPSIEWAPLTWERKLAEGPGDVVATSTLHERPEIVEAETVESFLERLLNLR
jgi:hypothetical protein